MVRFFTTMAFALALGAAASSLSVAQTTSQSMPMMGMMGGRCAMMGMMGQEMMAQGIMGQGMMGGPGKMTAMVEGRLAFLKSALGITDAQNKVWDDYADAAKAKVNVMQGRHQNMMDTMLKGNAVQRMNARIASMEAMLESMKAVKPATEKLYAALSDEQKKLADQLIGIDCGAM